MTDRPPEDLPESILEADGTAADVTGYHAAVREAKKRAVIRAIERARGSHADTARSLGLHPNNLHRLIRNLNLKTERGK